MVSDKRIGEMRIQFWRDAIDLAFKVGGLMKCKRRYLLLGVIAYSMQSTFIMLMYSGEPCLLVSNESYLVLTKAINPFCDSILPISFRIPCSLSQLNHYFIDSVPHLL